MTPYPKTCKHRHRGDHLDHPRPSDRPCIRAQSEIKGFSKSFNLASSLMSSRATIRDVAREARVSTATVSRYLNKNIVLPDETAARIDGAILALHYRPNVVARRLLKGATEIIGLATPDIGNPFFAELARAVEARAAEHGYSVILCSTGNRLDKELGYVERLASRHADGLLFMTNHGDDGALRRALESRHNVVLLDEDIKGLDAPKIFVENERGGYLATRCLIEAGHTKIAHISGPKSLFSVQERERGFRRALAESGIRVPEAYIIFGRYDREFGHDAAEKLLCSDDRPTAIFAASDYLVMGVLDGLREIGLSAPRDISLVGFDDMAFASLLDPPITTIRQPVRQMGERGVDVLLARIRGEEGPAKSLRLAVELIERGSVAPPAKLTLAGAARLRGRR